MTICKDDIRKPPAYHGRRRLVKLHPAQKPVALLSWCIQKANLQPDSCIFDPFMGSASMGVSALRAGHRYIGCEIEERYFDIACERLENALRQERLFA